MIDLTRRSVITGTVAVGTTALASMGRQSPARAAAPLAGKQAPGWYRYKVGSFEITVVTDGNRPTPLPDNIVKNAQKDAVLAAVASLTPGVDAKPPFPFNPVVVNTGQKLVAIDTGFGPGMYEQSKGAIGQYQTNLAAAGIDPKAVDVVIISHFHGDHIGGLIGADSKPLFPNAEIMVPKAEWDYWMDDGNKVTPYESNKELVSGITSIFTPGHTLGHTSHIVASGSDRLMVQADVTAGLGLVFARNPGWHVAADMDGPLAEQSRRKLYDMVAADKLVVQGYHFPFPAVGYVEKDGSGYRVTPVFWNTAL
jgi:glyoxylase-like metal-dependent hydrolase (beta-lactamase superfamily II)